MHIFSEIRYYCKRCKHEWSVIDKDEFESQYNQRKQCPICGSRFIKDIDYYTYIGDKFGNYIRDITTDDYDKIKTETKTITKVKKTSTGLIKILIEIFKYTLVVVSALESVMFMYSFTEDMRKDDKEYNYIDDNNIPQAESIKHIIYGNVEEISAETEKSDMELLAEKIDAEIKADTAHKHADSTEVEICDDGTYKIYYVYDNMYSYSKEYEWEEGEVLKEPLEGYIIIKNAEVISRETNKYVDRLELGVDESDLVWVYKRGHKEHNIEISDDIKKGDIVCIKGYISDEYYPPTLYDERYSVDVLTQGTVEISKNIDEYMEYKSKVVDEKIKDEIANDIIHSNAVGTEVEKYDDGTYRIYWVYEDIDTFLYDVETNDTKLDRYDGYIIIKRANIENTYYNTLCFGKSERFIVYESYMPDGYNKNDSFYIKGHVKYTVFRITGGNFAGAEFVLQPENIITIK